MEPEQSSGLEVKEDDGSESRYTDGGSEEDNSSESR